MDRQQLRLECLKLASPAAHHGPAEVVGRARIFESFILEPEGTLVAAPPPPREEPKADKKSNKKGDNPLS